MSRVKEPVITIDGASGTGKGTVSQLLAKRLGWKLLDSGALYRVLALAAQKHHVSLQNEKALEVLAEHLDVQFIAQENRLPIIILEGENVTDTIRTEKIGNAASIVAALPAVRASLLSRQRAFREPPGLLATWVCWSDFVQTIVRKTHLNFDSLVKPQLNNNNG